MAACAHDLLSARKPPSLTTAIKRRPLKIINHMI
jgi:hypothetical protein